MLIFCISPRLGKANRKFSSFQISTDAWKAIPMHFLKSIEMSTSHSNAITIQRSWIKVYHYTLSGKKCQITLSNNARSTKIAMKVTSFFKIPVSKIYSLKADRSFGRGGPKILTSIPPSLKSKVASTLRTKNSVLHNSDIFYFSTEKNLFSFLK